MSLLRLWAGLAVPEAVFWNRMIEAIAGRELTTRRQIR
jgi:hypothetical protein